MSLDPQWVGALGAIFVPALGHLYHFMLAANITSGWGLRETALTRLRLVLLSILVASSAFLLASHMQNPWWNSAWPMRAYAILCLVSGGFILPLSSLRIGMRRRPTGVSGRSDLLDLGPRPDGEPMIGEGKGNWLLRIPGNESFQLVRREWIVHHAGLPRALEGLTIVQLSDLHFGAWFRPAFFERVVDECLQWKADIVVITGDLVEAEQVIPWIQPVLAPLEARLGKYAILGNHDAEHDPALIARELSGADFIVLEGRWCTLEEGEARLAIGGTSEPWGKSLRAGAMPAADFRILLSHSPDQFYKARRWGVELVLSGHNHGGQIRLPALGPLFMPSVYSRRFDRGFFRSGSTFLYVSEGLAGKHPYRFGCPPEITRFVLSAEPATTFDEALPISAARSAARGKSE
jgi:predicted MPP superfamily phosphohydrolase